MSHKKLPTPSSNAEIDAFLRKAATMPVSTKRGQGRLIFALDATASRQPTWDRACQLQAEMFTETVNLGGLRIQPVWYRGFNEFQAGPWSDQTSELLRCMGSVSCLGGMTQIKRVLGHALAETQKHRVNALVFVGDCMEEKVDELCAQAGQLGLLGVPVFVFHEGAESIATRAFQQIAQLSHGAYCPFDRGSAKQLRELLGAVAVYAAGGQQALEDLGRRKGGMTLRLINQMRNK